MCFFSMSFGLVKWNFLGVVSGGWKAGDVTVRLAGCGDSGPRKEGGVVAVGRR